jgi:hypothetical protein
MGREVRKVPADWVHPQEWVHGQYTFKPLFEGDLVALQAEWDAGNDKWKDGFVSDWHGGWVPKPLTLKSGTYAEYDGDRPKAKDYMPQWSEAEKTHFMMYETCTEGTPISPSFATLEELARWLTDNEASAWGDQGASYEGWLRTAKGGYAPSMVLDSDGLRSGVDL